MSFVNIVILVRDRYRLTEQCLRSLAEHTPRERYRLTCVDDDSRDFRVRELLRVNIEHQPNIDSVLNVRGSGHRVGKLKTLGVEASRILHGEGDWLYVGDCDTCFLPGWMDTLQSAATEHERFRLWGGQIHPFLGYVPLDSKVGEAEVLDGPSWFMRWFTWHEIGPLTGEAAGPCRSEDAEWCARLRARGGRIGVVVPHVVVHTGLTQTDGKDAPGRDVREKQKVAGVIYE